MGIAEVVNVLVKRIGIKMDRSAAVTVQVGLHLQAKLEKDREATLAASVAEQADLVKTLLTPTDAAA